MKMSLPLKSPPRPRISFAEAMQKILEQLAIEDTVSIATLSRLTGIDRRTVSKVLETISNIQDILRNRELILDKVGNSYAVRLIQKTAEIGKRITKTGSQITKRMRRR